MLSTVHQVLVGVLPKKLRTMAPSVSARFVQALLGIVLILGVLVPGTRAQSIAFVQENFAVPSNSHSSASATYGATQTAGNTNIVAIGWSDSSSSVTSVTDTVGNSYSVAVGPTVLTGTQTQVIYVAANIAAAAPGANTVTVNFSATVPFVDVRILEYSGIDPSAPVDGTAGTTGTGTTSSSGTLTTTHAYDLIFAANYVTSGTNAAGNGYVNRVITTDGDIAEDQTVAASGTYAATASLVSSGSWIMQAVALRGAASAPPGADPSVVGQWGSVTFWPILPIHVTLLPTGKVLAYGHDSTVNTTLATIWDPATNSFTPTSFGAADLFCSGHSLLPDGRVFIAGGHNMADYHGITNGTIFNPTTLAWSSLPAMSFGRWYPTITALPDGRMLVTSGAINCDGCNATTPEIYDPVANSWTQLTTASLNLPIYPHMFVLPDGRVLNTGSYELPVAAKALNLSTQTWTTIDPTVLDAGSAVMYLPGKILKTGTSATSDSPYKNSAATAYILDMTAGSPAWRTTNSLNFARTYHNMTSLPDGNVLVTGGEGTTNPFDQSTAVYAAEMWSPTTETFTLMASMQTARVYHSTALLLPDGRVLVGGSGEFGTGSIDQLNAEIYSPPYLFKGARPTITSAPSSLTYGAQFTVQTPNAANISSVSLIRTGSVTHAFNQNQRYIPLSFTASSGSLTVQAPGNANLAPPGYYLLFVVNSSGVPSVASFIQMEISGSAPPPTVISVTPNSGTSTGGTGVTIAGTGFVPGATVTFGGTTATGVTVASSTSITASTPAHAAGAVAVAVTNTDSQSGSLNNGYTYTAVNPAPTVTSISPNSGTSSGGTAVTITGTGFLSGASVSLAGSAATGVTVVSSTSITAVSAAHAAGTGNVVVTNTDGHSGTLSSGYTYTVSNSAPTVTSVTPNSGSANGGTGVTIAGTGFLSGATVSFGGAGATGVTVVNSTSIAATTPAHAAGAVSVTVTNTNAQNGALANGYTYTSSLGLLSVGSASATVAAGQAGAYSLSIGGAGLSGTASLSCTGAPLGATCSVPSSQPFSSTTTTAFTVTVTTTSRTIASLRPPASSHVPWSWTLAMTMLGIVFLPGIRAPRRSMRRSRYLWLAPVALTLLLASCGGGGTVGGGPTGGTQSNPNGTPAGTYNLSLTASVNSGSTTQTIPLTLIVK